MAAIGTKSRGERGASGVRLHEPRDGSDGPRKSAWKINGFRAWLVVWDVGSWEDEEPKPVDAQPIGPGLWGAIRME